MLTRNNFIGPWAGLPVNWDKSNRFNEDAYRENVSRCCKVGVPGVYTGGTCGEFYAMELDEFRAITEATVSECHRQGAFAMIGCTSTYTRGAALRASIAADEGADAIQVAFPFWMELQDNEVVPFIKEVSAASGDLPLSIYETHRAKKTLTIEQHMAVKDSVPNYLMVKANPNTIGTTREGCCVLSTFINVFTSEVHWGNRGPVGACGACSAMVFWNPRITLALWGLCNAKNWAKLSEELKPLISLRDFLYKTYMPKGFTCSAFDRMGSQLTKFINIELPCRAPYRSPTDSDVETLREWCHIHFPDMLEV